MLVQSAASLGADWQVLQYIFYYHANSCYQSAGKKTCYITIVLRSHCDIDIDIDHRCIESEVYELQTNGDQ